MKPSNATGDCYAEYNENPNKKHPKFKVDDHGRILKYKNIFARADTRNQLEKFLVICKVKVTVPWTYVISDWNGEEITGSFYEKELQ